MSPLFLCAIAKVVATIPHESARERDRETKEKPMDKKNDRSGLMIALVMLALLGLILALNH